MGADSRLQFWLVIWAAVAVYILFRHWRTGRGTGLVFTYVFSLAAMHWLAATIYLLPWYGAAALDHTILGLRVSTIGLIAFAVGGEIGARFFERRVDDMPEVSGEDGGRLVANRIVNLYIVAGVLFYGVVFPLVAALPTASALASAASSLMVLGVCLKAWNAWQRGRPMGAWMWLGVSAVFPIVTVVGQGFLGYGFAAMVIVAAFVASFYRPRWQVVIAGLLVAYIGLSVYVTYMRDRRDIRAVVWGGEDIGSRIGTLAETFGTMEWFSVNDVAHLRRVDDRLNQDALVGAAVEGIETGAVPPAYGGTLVDAAIALVPRALWPAKPVVAGSGDIVSYYTGYIFPVGTSVGVGHVMEWYINFVMPGVFVGFVLIGAATVFVDRTAAVWLHAGEVGRFSKWFLPGLSLLQVGGSFVEVTSAAAASFVIAWGLDRVTCRWELPIDDDVVEQHS